MSKKDKIKTPIMTNEFYARSHDMYHAWQSVFKKYGQTENEKIVGNVPYMKTNKLMRLAFQEIAADEDKRMQDLHNNFDNQISELRREQNKEVKRLEDMLRGTLRASIDTIETFMIDVIKPGHFGTAAEEVRTKLNAMRMSLESLS